MAALFMFFVLSVFSVTAYKYAVTENIAPVSAQSPAVLGSSTDSDPYITEINLHRTRKGLSEIEFSEELREVANDRAQDMVLKQYYSHQSPSGETFSDLVHTAEYACENLQLQASDSLNGAIRAWENSPAHNQCLNHENTSEAAVVVAEYGDYTYDDRQMTAYVFVYLARQN